MAPSEHPREWRASLETSSDGKLAPPQKAIPAAHVTFIIDCATGKWLSLTAPPVPPQALSPNWGPVAPTMKTYTVFCGENQPHSTQVTPLDGGCLAQTEDTLPSYRGVVAPVSLPVSPPCPQDVPKANGSPLKARSARPSTWGAVKGSLKVISSCVCGQAD
ncbi:steroid receptor-associated and regulated protein isoform X1 [Castor canadensis]|uniref:steroid receptor-associated and regulated protein isoform X1 n=1 Tax=Castor canadensis TaxID=51338 RepID=UPI003D16352D